MLKILTVVGARPQFVKASVVSRAITTHNRDANGRQIREIIVHTGQHFDERMSEIFFREMGIPEPDFNLGIGGMSHGAMTGRMIEAIEEVLLKETPDLLLVYGDTNSTLAGAVAATKLKIPVAHVEAGLRSFNRAMPEEINRVLTDHAADILFAPTEVAVANLRREGIPSDRICRTGDVMFDAALYFAGIAEKESNILELLDVPAGSYALATIHRAENTDTPDRLRAILDGLAEVARDLHIVLPLHPRTRATLSRLGWEHPSVERFHLIEPIGYLDMIMLEKNARLIATDSGGVQKEAYFFRVPCVTLRDETEWVELVEEGVNQLCVPTDGDAVAHAIRTAISRGFPPGAREGLYGNGDAAGAIVERLLNRS